MAVAWTQRHRSRYRGWVRKRTRRFDWWQMLVAQTNHPTSYTITTWEQATMAEIHPTGTTTFWSRFYIRVPINGSRKNIHDQLANPSDDRNERNKWIESGKVRTSVRDSRWMWVTQTPWHRSIKVYHRQVKQSWALLYLINEFEIWPPPKANLPVHEKTFWQVLWLGEVWRYTCPWRICQAGGSPQDQVAPRLF